jgi:hypothetical protein
MFIGLRLAVTRLANIVGGAFNPFTVDATTITVDSTAITVDKTIA